VKIRVLSADDVARLLPMRECIEVMERALAKFARGEAVQPVRLSLPAPADAGIVALMPAQLAGIGMGYKAVSVFHGNAALNLPTHMATVALHDPQTGVPIALMDGTRITEIRTAAVSAVATRHLSRTDATVLTIFGTGVQARAHARAIACVRELAEVRIVGRRSEAARALADELGKEDLPARAVDGIEAALEGADIVVTATASPTPLFDADHLGPGVHINAVGSSTPKAHELPAATVAAARLFVDDTRAALVEAGDILLAIGEGAIDEGHIAGTLGEVIIGQVKGRTDASQITVFESLGLGLEDVAAASHVYAAALADGSGTEIEL
jgi:ornithine cyclodeaminase